jgi:hypothetical protein
VRGVVVSCTAFDKPVACNEKDFMQNKKIRRRLHQSLKATQRHGQQDSILRYEKL